MKPVLIDSAGWGSQRAPVPYSLSRLSRLERGREAETMLSMSDVLSRLVRPIVIWESAADGDDVFVGEESDHADDVARREDARRDEGQREGGKDDDGEVVGVVPPDVEVVAHLGVDGVAVADEVVDVDRDGGHVPHVAAL